MIMRLVLSVLIILLSVSYSFAQQSNVPIQLTIKASYDTVYQVYDSLNMGLNYDFGFESIHTITADIKNISDSVIEIEDDFSISYEDEQFTNVHYNTWYLDNDSFRKYNRHWADICPLLYDEYKKTIIKLLPNEVKEVSFSHHPFSSHGIYGSGTYQLQMVLATKYGVAYSNILQLELIDIADFPQIDGLDSISLYKMAEQYYHDSNFYLASALYYEMIKKYRGVAGVSHKIAMCAYNVGNYDRAAFLLSHYKSGDYATAKRYSTSLFKAGKYLDAVKEYYEIMDKYNLSAAKKDYYYELISLCYQKQAHADSNDVFKLLSKASAYEVAGEYAKAVEYYDRAERLDTGFLDYGTYNYSRRGYCKYQLGKYTEAIEDMLKDKGSQGFIKTYRRALTYFSLGEYDKVCENLKLLSSKTVKKYTRNYEDTYKKYKASIISMMDICGCQ